MDQRCQTAVDTLRSKLPSCRDIFDVLFHEVESHRPCISILQQIKIRAVHRQWLLYCIQICLKCLLSLFCFFSSEATVRLPCGLWAHQLNKTIINAFHWLFQAFEALSKERLCSLKIKASIDFVLKLKKFPPKELKYFKTAGWELSTWNWRAGPTSTTEALELKAMWRNLQRPETRLSWSPAVTLQKPRAPSLP